MASTPWDNIRGQYLTKLERTSQLIKRTDELLRYEQGTTPQCRELKTRLDPIFKNTSKQLDKLKNDEFHVAVVGLEKSGKSTFLNAWLRCDLLPNQTTRCTFTTTEIRSAVSTDQQRLVIEYMSEAEFDRLVSDYEIQSNQQGRDGENARKDLEEIKRDLPILKNFIGRAEEVIRFDHLEDIVEPLRQAVAEPTQARTVKRALIYTTELSGRTGLVFHDVPGYDSPTKLHKDLARYELARADVIICVTNISSQVSITESLLSMLDVADVEDKEIKAHQKMFVFLNQADRTQSLSEFEVRYGDAVKEWHERYDKCIPDRIVPGSAGVYIRQNIAKYFHPATQSGVEGAEFKFAPPHGDGIDYLKSKIDHYLDHERADVLKKRCEALISKSVGIAKEAVELISPLYPGSIEDIESNLKADEDNAFNEYFDETWKRYKEQFAAYWSDQIMPTGGDLDKIVSQNPKLANIRDAYNECISHVQDRIFSEEKIKTEYQRLYQGNIPGPTETNISYRKNLQRIALKDGLEQIIQALLTSLLSVIREIEDWVVAYFFDLEAIRPITTPIEDKSFYEKKLHYGFETLFNRFARPTRQLILATPRGSHERRRVVKEAYKNDVELLELYYDGDASKRDLRRYLLEGRWEPATAERIANGVQDLAGAIPHPVAKAASSVLDVLNTPTTPPYNPTAATFEELTQELREDGEAFMHYLRHAVYHAASFEEFCQQELISLNTHLLDDEMHKKVRRVFVNAKHSGDPRITSIFKSSEANTRHKREVMAKLAELKPLLAQH